MRINPNDRIKYLNKVKFDNISNINVLINEVKKSITFSELCNIVANVTDIKVNCILAKNKKTNIVKPRQICHYMAYLFITKNKSQIGMYIGEKDHATVIHSIKCIKDIIETKYPLNTYIDIIKIYNKLMIRSYNL